MLKSLVVSLFAIFLFACSGTENEKTSDRNEDAEPSGGKANDAKSELPSLVEASAETKQLWGDIAGYETWPKFEENTDLQKSETHNGMWVVSYYNEAVQEATDDGSLPLADGAVIVKENYMAADDPAPMVLTVMSKVNGEWYWVQGTPHGQVFDTPDGPLEGNDLGMCVMCHSAGADNDYVMTHTF